MNYTRPLSATNLCFQAKYARLSLSTPLNTVMRSFVSIPTTCPQQQKAKGKQTPSKRVDPPDDWTGDGAADDRKDSEDIARGRRDELRDFQLRDKTLLELPQLTKEDLWKWGLNASEDGGDDDEEEGGVGGAVPGNHATLDSLSYQCWKFMFPDEAVDLVREQVCESADW